MTCSDIPMMKEKIPMTTEMPDMNKEAYYALSLLTLVLIILAISPMLNSGYISDDSWVSCKAYYPSLKVMLHDTYEQIKLVTKSHGHLTILWLIESNVVFFLTQHDPFLYKLFILCMILVNVGLFEYFIYKLSRSRITSLLSIISLPLLFQFRNYHDPILSFAGQQQLILTTLLISLLFLLDYFDNGKKSRLWLSIFFYFLCLQIYENTYSFFLFHMLIVYLKAEKKTFMKNSLPFVVLPVLLAIIVVSLRHFYPSNYTGTVPSFDLSRILLTFFKQVFASFPMSYFMFYFKKDISYDYSFIYKHYIPHILLLISVSGIFAHYLFKKISEENRRIYSNYHILAIGVMFLLVPALLISLSQKYQEELTWGIGYIPVYISYYGVSLLFAFLLLLLINRIPGRKILGYLAGLFAGIMFCFTIALNYINNSIVVDNLNYTFLYPRGIIEEAARKGLFKFAADDSLLYINGEHHWDGVYVYVQTQQQFYDSIAPRKFTDIVRIKDIENVDPPMGNKLRYYLNYVSLSHDSGYAILGKLLAAPEDGLSDMKSREIYVYVRVPYYKPIVWDWNVFYPKISLWGKWSDDSADDADFVFLDYHPSVNMVSSGIDWRMYKITPDKSIDVRTMVIHVGRQYVAVTNTVELNQAIYFREAQFFPKGWSIPESDHRWNDGKEAVVTFHLKDATVTGKQYGLAISGNSNGRQRVTILLNGTDIGALDFSGTYETKKLLFDSRLLRANDTNTFSILIPNAAPPGNGDPRVLGISLNHLIITDHI